MVAGVYLLICLRQHFNTGNYYLPLKSILSYITPWGFHRGEAARLG